MYFANHELQIAGVKGWKTDCCMCDSFICLRLQQDCSLELFQMVFKFNTLDHVFVEYVLILGFYFFWDFVFLFL